MEQKQLKSRKRCVILFTRKKKNSYLSIDENCFRKYFVGTVLAIIQSYR